MTIPLATAWAKALKRSPRVFIALSRRGSWSQYDEFVEREPLFVRARIGTRSGPRATLQLTYESCLIPLCFPAFRRSGRRSGSERDCRLQVFRRLPPRWTALPAYFLDSDLALPISGLRPASFVA